MGIHSGGKKRLYPIKKALLSEGLAKTGAGLFKKTGNYGANSN